MASGPAAPQPAASSSEFLIPFFNRLEILSRVPVLCVWNLADFSVFVLHFYWRGCQSYDQEHKPSFNPQYSFTQIVAFFFSQSTNMFRTDSISI